MSFMSHLNTSCILVYLLITTVYSLLSFNTYDCIANQTCIINCNSTINSTQCTNLTINAKNASSLKISCENNTYCDSMKIICPYCADCFEWSPINCNIRCTGGDQVCSHLQININKSVSLITCSGTNACNNLQLNSIESMAFISCSSQNQTACTQTHIKSHSTAIYFTCGERTNCDSIHIENTCNYSQITLLNDGIMNNFNLTAPDAKQLQFEQNGLYSNAFIKNKSPYINDASFVSSEFHVNSMLFRSDAFFMNNTIYCSSHVRFGFEGTLNVKFNRFYVNSNGSITLDVYTMFQFNNIYANNASLIDVSVSGSQISNNNIYAQYASYVKITTDDYRVKMYNNSIYAHDAGNLTLNIFGGIFSNNNIYGNNVNRFTLLCPFHMSQCGSISDSFMLSNAMYVLIQAGDGNGGGVITGGYFAVQNVTNVFVISNFGFISNINVNAINAKYVRVDMVDGSLYNSTINGLNTDIFSVNCYSTNYWSHINNTNCNKLTLITPNKTKTSLLCDGYGCEKLVLYTINGAEDINVTGINCDCKEDISTACINEWEIYCKDNGYSEASIFSTAKKCDGVCCDNIVNMLHDDKCSWSTHDHNEKFKAIYVIIPVVIIVVFIIFVIKWLVISKYAENKSKKEPLLVQ